MPMASDALSPAAVHNSRNSSKRSPATLAWTRQAIPHNMVRGAMRMAARCGSSAGSASAIVWARSQLSRAAAMARFGPRCGTHVPAVGGVQIPGGLQMFGNQGSVFVARFRLMAFDRGSQPPMQPSTIRLQLRLVGHRTNQWMVEHILGLSGEPDLVDQFGLDQLVEG